MTEVADRREDARHRRFRPYPEYKASGVEWLGEIPAHWDVERLKYLATLNDEALAWIIREDGDSGGDTGASVWYKRCAHKRLATTEAPA